jgi:MFS family permease
MEHNISLSRKGLTDLLSLPISRSLWVGIFTSFLLRMAGGATGVLLVKYLNARVAPARGEDFIDPGIIGLLTGIYFATELLGAPVLGAFSDFWGRKPLLLLGPLFGAIAVQIHPLTTVIIIIALARMFEGLAAACNIPATLGFLADATGGNAALRGRVMGIFEIASLVGLAIGPTLGGALWDGINLPTVALYLPGLEVNGLRAVSIVYLVSMVLIFLFITETRPGTVAAPHTAEAEMGALVAVATSGPDPVVVRETAQGARPSTTRIVVEELRARVRGYRELLRLPRLTSFTPAWITVNAVLGLWFNHVAALLTRTNRNPNQLLEGGYSLTQVGQIFFLFAITFGIGILFWSLFYARIRKTNMMLAAVFGTIGVCVTGLLINNQVLPGNLALALAVPLIISLFVMSGFTPVALAYLADISEDRAQDRGMVMGLYSVLLGVGQLGGALLGVPFVQAWGFNGLLLATGLLALFAIGVIVHLRRVSGD